MSRRQLPTQLLRRLFRPALPRVLCGLLCLTLPTLTLVAVSGAAPVWAAKLKVPRFVSLRFATVNLRAGPGTQYPINWVYKRRGLPVEVIRDLDNWRRIRDRWGTVGWIHVSNLSGKRTVLVDGKALVLRSEPKDGARPVARAQVGVIAEVDECAKAWCRLTVGGHRGWAPRTSIWGVYPRENFD